MDKRDIIVIGASAGGFEMIRQLIGMLPADLKASIFIAWHIAPEVKGILPHVLNKHGALPAMPARDKEPILPGRVYVAPPDKHLVLEKDRMRVTQGPKENGFRPAVDPLFRSAAFHFGSRVIGIILSGALDDGTAGLWTIKHFGGIAIAQHPEEAEVDSMPLNAIREVPVDHIIPVAEMSPLLVKLSQQRAPDVKHIDPEMRKKTEKEIRIAIGDEALKENIMQFGEFTSYTCPECHGVLSAIREGERVRFRCHTGHAFSADSLLATVTGNVEQSLWNAIRAMEESILLLNHMGDHFAEVNQPHLAARYFKKANEVMNRSQLVRKAVFSHEHLTTGQIMEEAQKNLDRST